MRTFSNLRAAVLPAALVLSMGVLVAACDEETAKQQTSQVEQYVDDATITTRVKAGLLKDPTLEKLKIEVETSQRVVQLSGFVDSEATKDLAEEVAENTEGVKDVENDIIVR